jgi:hypothetical protein
MGRDVEDGAWAASPLPVLVPVEEPEEGEAEAEPMELVEEPEEGEAEAEPCPPAELLTAMDGLVLAEALDPVLLPHAVSERPAAATIRARAGMFLTRIETPGKRCRIGIGCALRRSGHS